MKKIFLAVFMVITGVSFAFAGDISIGFDSSYELSIKTFKVTGVEDSVNYEHERKTKINRLAVEVFIDAKYIQVATGYSFSRYAMMEIFESIGDQSMSVVQDSDKYYR